MQTRIDEVLAEHPGGTQVSWNEVSWEDGDVVLTLASEGVSTFAVGSCAALDASPQRRAVIRRSIRLRYLDAPYVSQHTCDLIRGPAAVSAPRSRCWQHFSRAALPGPVWVTLAQHPVYPHDSAETGEAHPSPVPESWIRAAPRAFSPRSYPGMSTTQQRLRHERGTRTAGIAQGGRFRRDTSTEPTGNGLMPPADREMNEEMREVHSAIRKMVTNSWRQNRRVLDEREDIRQEAVIRMWEWAQKTGNRNLVRDHGGLARHMLNQEVLKVRNNHQHHTSAEGRQELLARIDLREEGLGRRLTPRERDELAVETRMWFSAGQRPREDYADPVHPEFNIEINEEPDEDDDDYRGLIAVEDSYPSEQDPEGPENAETYDRARMRLEEGAEKRLDAKRRIWEVMAEADDRIPQVVPLTVTQERKIRGAMGGEGTVQRVAQAHLLGQPTPHGTDNLFVPFGGRENLTDEQQDAIAERLASGPAERGSELWTIALRAAGRKGREQR